MERGPWCFPVPIQPGQFEGLAETDRNFNVHTNVNGLNDPFAYRQLSADSFVYADAQFSFPSFFGRWGSGRAGFYKGHYLKGIGLTPLAANWRSDDLFHSSGRMSAMAGAWEYLISKTLEKIGLGDSINPCKTILIAPNEKSYRDSLLAYSKQHGFHLSPSSQTLRALTVKDGQFIRPSHIIWLIQQNIFEQPDQDPYSAAHFFLWLFQGSRGDFLTAPTELELARLTQEIDSAFARTLENCRRFFAVGLDWGSYHNNFTLDGRFLDLETPIFMGQPFWGWISQADGTQDSFDVGTEGGRATGLNYIHVIFQWRYFITVLIQRLRFIAKYYSDLRIVHLSEIFAFLAQSLEETFTAEHILFNQEKLEQWFVDLILNAIDTKDSNRTKVADFVKSFCDNKFSQAKNSTRLNTQDHIEIHYSQAGLVKLFTFRDFRKCGSIERSDLSRRLYETISELSAITDRGTFLERLRQFSD